MISLVWLQTTLDSEWVSPRLDNYIWHELSKVEKLSEVIYYSIVLIWAEEVAPRTLGELVLASSIILFGVFVQA